MNSVGTLLKAERERQGREVAEIAEALCITQSYLRAIEQDDLKSLPGTFFYKSFAKQYAAIVGVDYAALQPGIEALTATGEPLPLPGADVRYPVRETREREGESKPVRALDPIVADGNRRYFGESRIGLSIAGLVAVLLGCSGFYSWYNRAPRAPSVSQAPAVSQVPAVSPAPAPTPTSSIESVKAEAPAPKPPSVDVTTTTDNENHVVLNLSATEKTWISIVCDGKQIFSGVLEPSQTKTLTGVEVAKMKVGNAAGLDVRWNGKPIGPIGPRGQVRVVLFTPENFQILHASDAM